SALSSGLSSTSLPRRDRGGRLLVIAFGKAAVPMAETLLRACGVTEVAAIVVTNYEYARPVAGAEVHAAGHPVPDENGARAAEAVEALLRGASAADRVV